MLVGSYRRVARAVVASKSTSSENSERRYRRTVLACAGSAATPAATAVAVAAVACAVLLNGTVSSLTPETTWKDLFPDTVEDDSPLSKFYGPLDKYAHRAE